MGLLHPDKVAALSKAVGTRPSKLATPPRKGPSQSTSGSSLVEQLAAKIYQDHALTSGRYPDIPLPEHTRPLTPAYGQVPHDETPVKLGGQTLPAQPKGFEAKPVEKSSSIVKSARNSLSKARKRQGK